MAGQQISVGQHLGHYRLVRLLGQGGFAEVYLGEHLHLKTLAAVKVLHTRLTQEDVQQFQHEAQTIAHLLHPHIIRVLDFGVEQGFPYLVMDYAPNGTLRRHYPRGTQVPLPTAVLLTRQIAEALHYAHERRIVHRDIKPENLLFGPNHEVLLSDFGIALALQSSRLYRPQDVAGTIAYMAPEQIQAHPGPASDQYALGVVAYEWLCSVRPFEGSYTEIAVKHSVTLPPPLRSFAPNLSQEVEQVVMTALQKDPSRRFPTVIAFAQALEQAAASQSSRSTFIKTPEVPSIVPPSAVLPYTPHTPYTPSSSAYPAMFATEMMPQSFSQGQPMHYSTPSYGAGQPQTPPQGQTPMPAQERPPLSRRAFLIGGGMVGAAAIGGAMVWLLLPRPDVPSALPKALLKPVNTVFHVQSDTPVLTLEGHTGPVLHVRWSPDGTFIASGSMDGTLIIWTAQEGKTRVSARTTLQPPLSDDYPWSIDWSARKDTQHLAVSFVDGTIQVLDANTGQRLSSQNALKTPVSVLAWSPDEQYIAVGGSDYMVRVYAYPSWNVVTTYQEHTNTIKSVAWSPDGTLLVSGSEDTTVRVWEPLSGKTRRIYNGHTKDVAAVSWSYDSTRIASSAYDNTVHIWDVAEGRTLHIYNAPSGAPIGEARWSHNNRFLAIYGGDAQVHILDTHTFAVTRSLAVSVVYSLSWSPDDTHLVTGNYDNVARIWSVM